MNSDPAPRNSCEKIFFREKAPILHKRYMCQMEEYIMFGNYL